MSHNEGAVCAERVKELGGRDATVLEQDCIRVMVDDIGGMVPELSYKNGRSRVNAHWIPWFRANSGKPFGEAEARIWKDNLLYNMAGNFPCAPNFAGTRSFDGVKMPGHGWAANLPWRFLDKGADGEAAWAVSTMESPEPAMPLFFKKIDAVVKGQPVHYTSMEISNRGAADITISTAWHNTTGAPFLQSGCKISGAADRWVTVPAGGAFDATARLALDAEFKSLDAAPLAAGGTVDISVVPGPIGYADFVYGAIPASLALGWAALVNPHLEMAYVTFFTGAAAAAPDDIILRFNNFWMQYSGRAFTPWAACEGGTDRTFCLALENSIAGFLKGSKHAEENNCIMGAPTGVCIPAGKSMTLRYGTFFSPYGGKRLNSGVRSAEGTGDTLVLNGTGGSERFAADTSFGILKKLERQTR